MCAGRVAKSVFRGLIGVKRVSRFGRENMRQSEAGVTVNVYSVESLPLN